ncbi:hypothetical protein TWF696_001067 [Orbilia brochopaga]|uniref:Uncharacterized protein n=1 Tax=Orbilia brochopaga TaxID=3140254 RepID=A0AAV9VFT4_9PEZI
MARETEKDYDHSYFRRGEKALINDHGKPDYVTHNAERAFYHYLRDDGTGRHKKPFVVLIQNYRNPQDEVMRKKGWRPESSQWRTAVEDICFDCECWVCPCGLLGIECVRDEDDEAEDEFEDLEGIEGWQGCRSCWYCWKGALAIVPLGENDGEVKDDGDAGQCEEGEGNDNHEMFPGY